MIQANSLLKYAKNIYSEKGDDGIIERIFSLLEIKKGFFVEFGAWDGILYSNGRLLFDGGWGGAFIEADPEKFRLLRENYRDCPQILCLQERVIHDEKVGPGQTLDRIADRHFPDRTIDFLSIDINGLDYNVFESIRRRPKVVCVEGGFSWHPEFSQRVPDEVAAKDLQQPLAVTIELGKRKGYEPVCFNQNLYFVLQTLSPPFQGIQNNAVTLWKDAWYHETDEFRERLLRIRNQNPLIRATEGDRFKTIEL